MRAGYIGATETDVEELIANAVDESEGNLLRTFLFHLTGHHGGSIYVLSRRDRQTTEAEARQYAKQWLAKEYGDAELARWSEL